RIGLDEGHPKTASWVATMREVASRLGAREMVARSLLHGARLGGEGDAELAAQLVADIANPRLSTEAASILAADHVPDHPAATASG
ncbi:MAG: hypothetical protein R3246_08735, partial [Acidimicrobiia bacterium]|nr:hypothetical protein [Acidimicrobiia bacterium]